MESLFLVALAVGAVVALVGLIVFAIDALEDWRQQP